ncbi:MAG: pantetheine-phosphate adenylyltransferase [Planctomycetota bacterium]|nr:pantetheine-phosphate adenylyltransferase [Planctomycetota bacterium]
MSRTTKLPGYRKAVYAGSFDPITNGHMYMIRVGAHLFDELVVSIGVNPDKRYTFSLNERLEFLRKCTQGIPNITLDHFSGLFLVDYARKIGARYILRGIRHPNDYEYERRMCHVNTDLNPRVVTAFLIPPRDISELSSSFVKGLVGPSGWETVVKNYVPAPIYKQFVRHFRDGKAKREGGGLKDMPEWV